MNMLSEEVTDLRKIKKIVDLAVRQKMLADGILQLTLPFSSLTFNVANELAQLNLVNSIYSFLYKGVVVDKELCVWDDLPVNIKGLGIKEIDLTINLKLLRMSGVKIYYDEHELVELSPSPPDFFMVINLSLNFNKCTICPFEYNENEIYRYFQLKVIWSALSGFADVSKESELLFLYKGMISIRLDYSFDDLTNEFEGLNNLLEINKEKGHATARKNIMQNTLYSILWNNEEGDNLRFLLKNFKIFVKTFEENYRAYTVSFSFDKIRKEYLENYRDYLAKINGLIYESLTRALAIPISGLIGFAVMNKNSDSKTLVVNAAALLLVVFSTIGMHFLISFQIRMVSITRMEFNGLFDRIKKDMEKLELREVDEKKHQLNNQANKVSNLLLCIYAVSLSNLIINMTMFFISSF